MKCSALYGAAGNADEHVIQWSTLPCKMLNTGKSTERHANQPIVQIRKAEILVLHDDLFHR